MPSDYRNKKVMKFLSLSLKLDSVAALENLTKEE